MDDEADPGDDPSTPDDPALAAILRGVARPEGADPAADEPPLAPGTMLAHFRIEALLGRGGMGVVYRARDVSLGRVVALKVLASGVVGSGSQHKRFLREARANAEVRHPNIADVHEVGEAEGRPFIAMEHVEGHTLRRWREETRPPTATVVGVLRQALVGVAAVHAAGLVHRDLKPENFMVTPDGTVKLLDFGLARRVDARAEATERRGLTFHTDVGHVIGTVAYMSPEQATGDAVDMRSDVFSFGVMAYELLVGRRPFEGDSRRELIRAIVASAPPDPRRLQPSIGSSLSRVLLRALAKRPGDRYPDAGALAAALDQVGEAVGSRARGVAALVLMGAALALGAVALRGVAGTRGGVSASGHVPNGGACTNNAPCISGRCVVGTCQPWSVLVRGHGPDSVNALDVDDDDQSIVFGGYFRGGINLGCVPLAGRVAPGPDGSAPSYGLVARLRPDGVCMWSFVPGGQDAAGRVDGVLSIAGGHTIVTGAYGSRDFDLGQGPLPLSGVLSTYVMELDAWGGLVWATPVDAANVASAEYLARHPSGLFVAGGTIGATVSVGGVMIRPAPAGDSFIARLDGRGSVLWARPLLLDAPGAAEGIFGLASDARGDVTVLGGFDGVLEVDGVRLVSAGARDAFLLRLSGEDGRAQWGKSWGTIADELFEGAITIDTHGALFVAGEHRGADLGGGRLPGSMFVARLRAEDGAHVWSVGLGGAAPRDNFRRIAIDRAGDLVVAGRYFSPTLAIGDRTLTNVGGSDLLVARMSRDDGHLLGLATFPASDAPVRAMGYDARTDNVIVGGRFDGFAELGQGRVMVADQEGYIVSVGSLE